MSTPPSPKCSSCNSSRTVFHTASSVTSVRAAVAATLAKTRKRKLDEHIVVICLQRCFKGSSYKSITDTVGIELNAVSNWLEPSMNVIKDLRIDPS